MPQREWKFMGNDSSQESNTTYNNQQLTSPPPAKRRRNSTEATDKMQAYQSHWIIDAQNTTSSPNSSGNSSNNPIVVSVSPQSSSRLPTTTTNSQQPFSLPHRHQQQFSSSTSLQSASGQGHTSQSISHWGPAHDLQPSTRSHDSSISYAVDSTLKRKRGRRNKNPFSGQSITASQIQESLNPKPNTDNIQTMVIRTTISQTDHHSVQRMWATLDESVANKPNQYSSVTAKRKLENGKHSIDYIVN